MRGIGLSGRVFLQGYCDDMGLKNWDFLQFKAMGVEIVGTKASSSKGDKDDEGKDKAKRRELKQRRAICRKAKGRESPQKVLLKPKRRGNPSLMLTRQPKTLRYFPLS